jgi:hypothetical protein
MDQSKKWGGPKAAPQVFNPSSGAVLFCRSTYGPGDASLNIRAYLSAETFPLSRFCGSAEI